MAKYDPTHPALCLRGTVDPTNGVNGVEKYTENDESGLYDKFITFDFTITSISEQAIFDLSTRKPGGYTGFDVKVGDWITTDNGKIVLQIEKIYQKSDATIQLKARDVDGLTYRQYFTNYPSTSDTVIIFELSENGLPVLVGDATDYFADGAIDRIQSRFSIDEEDERYRFYHDVSPNVEIGDLVSVDSNGNLIKDGAVGAAKIPIGAVVSHSSGGKIVYVKPFNKILNTYPKPGDLTGNPGDIYYTDPDSDGGITTIEKENSKQVYMHIKNAIPTVIETSINTQPSSSDTIIINGSVVHQANTSSFNDLASFVTNINNYTAQTKVTASSDPPLVSIESDSSNFNGSINSAVSIVTMNGTDANPTFSYPSAIIVDGTNMVNITFNPNNYGLTTSPYLNNANYAQYQTIDANDIVFILNSEFAANSLKLIASTIQAPAGAANSNIYDGIKIETTDPTVSININNGSSDAFGNSFAGSGSITGLQNSISAQTQGLLKLTRADGGDILITGNPMIGGYINSNGLCSSSSGSSALLLMIEGSSEKTDVGVMVSEDHNMSPSATNGDGDPTGLTLTYTPFLGSKVEIRINGLDANLGNSSDYTVRDCYFSPDGIIIRDFKDIVAGDELYWNGNTSNFQLDSSDDIDFIYQTADSNLP